jgi:hypothetical protein
MFGNRAEESKIWPKHGSGNSHSLLTPPTFFRGHLRLTSIQTARPGQSLVDLLSNTT